MSVSGSSIVHAASGTPATVYASMRLSVFFDEAVRAVSPGQSIVLYDGERVIGGGEIV